MCFKTGPFALEISWVGDGTWQLKEGIMRCIHLTEVAISTG